MMFAGKIFTFNCLWLSILILDQHFLMVSSNGRHRRSKYEDGERGSKSQVVSNRIGQLGNDFGNQGDRKITRLHTFKNSRRLPEPKTRPSKDSTSEDFEELKSWFTKNLRKIKKLMVPLPLQNKTVDRNGVLHPLKTFRQTRSVRDSDYDNRGDYDDRGADDDRGVNDDDVEPKADYDDRDDRDPIPAKMVSSKREDQSDTSDTSKKSDKLDKAEDKSDKSNKAEKLDEKPPNERTKILHKLANKIMELKRTVANRTLSVLKSENKTSLEPSSSSTTATSLPTIQTTVLANHKREKLTKVSLTKVLLEMRILLYRIEKDLRKIMQNEKINMVSSSNKESPPIMNRAEPNTGAVKNRILSGLSSDKTSALVSLFIIVLITALTVGAVIIFVVKPRCKNLCKRQESTRLSTNAAHFSFSD